MNTYYNQHYTRENIEEILVTIKDCVMKNRFLISLNNKRMENIEFINNYNLSKKRQIDILLQLKVEDFCYSVPNIKPGYEHEQLYVFVPQANVFGIDGIEIIVDVYMKFNIVVTNNGVKTVVISFHQLNKPIDYLFK